jgi:hypothetical protein
MNGTSSSTLLAAYEQLHNDFASRSVFGKVWALSHASLAVSFETAYATLVWVALIASLSQTSAVLAHRTANLAFVNWANWLSEEEKKAGIQ